MQVMKKIVALLLITLLATTTSFSQNISKEIKQDSIVSITPQQLKETNLIFLEHRKLLQENFLLGCQLNNYKNDNALLVATDSLRVLQLRNYKELSDTYSMRINNLNNELSKKKKEVLVWQIGGVSVSIGLLVWLLLK